VITGHKQPSLLTIYPVMGIEGGSHIETHLPESGPPVRGLAGGDASYRVLFTWTHNFFGGTPITLYDSGALAGECGADDKRSKRRHADTGYRHAHFFAQHINGTREPESAIPGDILAWRASTGVCHAGNTVAVGLTFTNPGSSEH